MKTTKGLCAFVIVLLCGAVFAQQPNSGGATMLINGAAGFPYPILTNVPTNTVAAVTMLGAASQPYAIYQSPTLAVGSAFIPSNVTFNSVDLALTPFPALVVDGFANPAVFNTGPTGVGGFTIAVPNAGVPPTGIPVGLSLALQAAVADPFSVIGLTLTAATQVTVVPGPVGTLLNLSNNGQFVVNIAATPIPFYGTYYSSLTIDENGYIIMGAAPPSNPWSSPTMFDSGPPRVAGFWMDLAQGAGTIFLSTLAPAGTVPGHVRVDYINVQEFFAPGVTHTFSMILRTDGTVDIIQPPTQNAAAASDEITGIGPGNNFPQSQTNFVGPDPDGAGSQTTGILTTAPTFSTFGAPNQAFYEWYGNFTMPFYGNPYNNFFDLFARTLHFVPSAAGGLPGSTIAYFLF